MAFQHELIKSLGAYGALTAIEYNGREVSYAEVKRRADAVSTALLEAGVKAGAWRDAVGVASQDAVGVASRDAGAETIVAVLLKDRVDLICAAIGVMNARCVFVPVDPGQPAERLSLLMETLAPDWVILPEGEVGGGMGDALAKTGVDALAKTNVEALTAKAGPGTIVYGAWDEKAEVPLYPEYDEDDSLYIYFTSGTTGTPKGIMGRNGSLLHFLKWETETLGVSGVRGSQFISPYFDAFLRDVFVPLLTGGTVVIPPVEEAFLVPERITRWLDEQRIALIHCVPSFFRLINHAGLMVDNYASLRYVLLSGEKIFPADLRNWYQVFGERVQLVNLYGPTEATMIKSFYRISADDVRRAKMPIGEPIDGAQLLILDKSMKACGLLVPGELYIVSEALTKGYFKNPGLTAEKFVVVTIDGGLLPAFRTGDRARRLADGTIDLLGREDRQIKLRGIRVELDEIEQIILQTGLVKQAVVVGKATAGGESWLNAFIVGAAEETERIAAVVSLRLPAYMMPSNWYELPQLPLSSNGKINYKDLAAWSLTDKVLVEPANEIEGSLLTIWKGVLGDARISTDDSFHSLGGNSLSIMKLIGRIYKEFNVRISLEDVFNHPTIQGQAVVVGKLTRSDLMAIRPTEWKPYYPVTSAQGRVFYNYELNPQRTSYNLPMTWELSAQSDRKKIEDSFRKLIARHEGLRTSFGVEDGKVVQYVHDTAELELQERSCTDEDLFAAVMEFVRPFDLSVAPLLRAVLITTGSGRRVLVVDLHHIVADGMSQRILRSDFYRLYQGMELPALPIQYRDYAEWEYRFKKTEDYWRLRQFWLESLKGELPSLRLPVAGANYEDLSESGDNVAFELSKELFSPMLALVREEGLTSSSALFALYYLFLMQLTGQHDIVIGMAASGRLQAELEDVAGMFVKTMPVRYHLNPLVSFRSFLTGINKFLIQALSNQLYDLEDIISDLNSLYPGRAGRLFNAGFVFLNFDSGKETEEKEEFETYRFVNMGAKNAITLYVMERRNTFYFRLEFADAFFSRQDITLLIDRFTALAAVAGADPDQETGKIVSKPSVSAAVVEDDFAFDF